jgi:hypothetical protein
MKPRGRVGVALAVALVAAAIGSTAGCDILAASIFRPVSDPNPDTTPPVFSDPRPGPTVAVVNAPAFTIQVVDPPSGGAAGSGVDPTRIEANVIGGGAQPVTVGLPLVTIHMAGLPDGPLQIAVVARDFAGNSAVHVFSTILDRTAPTLGFSLRPPATVATAATTARIDFVVQVAEPNFESGTVEIRSPGPDGGCGTADDGEVPASVVAQPTRPLPGPGNHAFQYFLLNPVPRFGQPQAILYCWIVTARDAARSLDGAPGANTATLVGSTLVTWLPPAG